MEKSYYYSLPCVHNSGTHYTTGKHCSDCSKFINIDTLEAFITFNSLTIGMGLWNRIVSFNRGEIKEKPSAELYELCDKLMERDYLIKLSKNEAQEFMDKTYKFLIDNNISKNEAVKVIG